MVTGAAAAQPSRASCGGASGTGRWLACFFAYRYLPCLFCAYSVPSASPTACFVRGGQHHQECQGALQDSLLQAFG